MGVFLARFARATGSLRSRNWLASLAQLPHFARAFWLASLAQWAILFFGRTPSTFMGVPQDSGRKVWLSYNRVVICKFSWAGVQNRVRSSKVTKVTKKLGCASPSGCHNLTRVV